MKEDVSDRYTESTLNLNSLSGAGGYITLVGWSQCVFSVSKASRGCQSEHRAVVYYNFVHPPQMETVLLDLWGRELL